MVSRTLNRLFKNYLPQLAIINYLGVIQKCCIFANAIQKCWLNYRKINIYINIMINTNITGNLKCDDLNFVSQLSYFLKSILIID